MSIKAMNWAWERQGLGAGAKLTLIALSDNADDAGICWPGKKYVQAKTGLPASTLRRAFRELEDTGILTTQPQYREDGSQTSNVYRLQLDPPLQGEPPPLHPDTARVPPAEPQEPPWNHHGTTISPSPIQESGSESAETTELYEVLSSIPGFKTAPAKVRAWLEQKHISETQAVTTAYAVKSKWPGSKNRPYRDPWATFQHWVLMPPLRTSTSNGNQPTTGFPDKVQRIIYSSAFPGGKRFVHD